MFWNQIILKFLLLILDNFYSIIFNNW